MGAVDIVMVLGLGAVGMGTVMVSTSFVLFNIEPTYFGQTSKIRRCKVIIAVDRVKEHLNIVRTLGATHTIDNTSLDFTTLNEEARAYFPVGVSVVFDITGAPVLIEQGLRSTHTRGKLVCIGVPPLVYELGVTLVEHINVCYSILFSEFLTDFFNRKDVRFWVALKETVYRSRLAFLAYSVSE